MKLKELFDKPEKWTQHVSAKDINGFSTEPCSDTAISWCLVGGIVKCYGVGWSYKFGERMISEINKTIGISSISISEWNDHKDRTFEDIRALIEKLNI